MSNSILVSIKDLKKKIYKALTNSNTSNINALSVANALVNAEIDGKLGHGISRLPSYSAQAKSGKVDGKAVPKLKNVKPGVISVDASSGFAYPAFDKMLDALPFISKKQGVAIGGIYNSHHNGVAGHHVEKAANLGQVSILFGNTPSAIAPWNGSVPLFGTNPIAFGAPMPNGKHLIIDMAISKVARGKILKASQIGEKIPFGWALDLNGKPTEDPHEALKGTMIPFGNEKGAALAIMVELLAAGITGANFSFEADSFFSSTGKSPNVGQLMIMIDPGCIFSSETVISRMSGLINLIEKQSGTHIPGSKRFELRKTAKLKGIYIDKKTYSDITELAN